MQRLGRALALVALVAGCSSATPPTAPDAQPVTNGTPEPTGTGVTGRFVRTRYDVTGTATVRIANGVGVIELSSDFSIAQTPGPYLYLNTTNNPNTGQPIRIASLRGKSGAQRFTFAVPAGAQYTWLVIWCDPFNVPMAEAPITPVP
jgi:Electron transfer DM13